MCDRLLKSVIFGKMQERKNMSYFSDELQKLFHDRNVKIYLLSSVSGIDRTLIHKMLKGTRIPANGSMVQKLASVLLLTPEEAESLMDSYRITKMGEENYHRRKIIEDFFNHFNSLTQPDSILVQTDSRHQIDVLPGSAAVYGTLKINNLIRTAVEIEASRGDGTVRVVAQPEYSFLFECLALTGINHHDLKVNHIVCLENRLKGKEGLYNLNCLRTMMPVILSGCKYNPMCYYDNVASHISGTSIMPYMLLTREYAIHISYDLSCATVSNSQEYIALYSRIFEELEKKSTSMLAVDYEEWNKSFPEMAPEHGPKQYTFSFEPDPVPFLTEESRSKYLQPKSASQEKATALKEGTLAKEGAETVYFTKEGLEQFLNTGMFPKMYREFFLPLNTENRNRILKMMYEAAVKGTFQPVLIHSGIFRIPEYLSVFVFQDTIHFIFTLSGDELRSCVLKEKSLVLAFRDFFKYLPESSVALSPEESLAIIKSKLNSEQKNTGNKDKIYE